MNLSMYEGLQIFAIIAGVVAAAIAIVWGAFLTKGAEREKAFNDVFRAGFYLILVISLAVVPLFVVGIIGVFLARNEKLTLALARRYAPVSPSTIVGRIAVAAIVALLISISIYVGTIAGIVVVRGLAVFQFDFPMDLWAEAFSEANPRFQPFLAQTLTAFILQAMIEWWRRRLSPGRIRLMGGLAIHIIFAVVFSFGFVLHPELWGASADMIFVNLAATLQSALIFPVEVITGFSSDPRYVLRYVSEQFGSANGNLYLLVALYPKIFVSAAVLYFIFSLPMLLTGRAIVNSD